MHGFNSLGEPREELGGGGAVQSFGAVEVEKRLSSIDKGSTNGVSRRISARTSRPTALYFAISGRMTTASGQAANALNIGIAERTP